MAKKGKKVGKQHYEPKYREAFKDLMKGQKVDVANIIQTNKYERPGTFLGFRLKRENINQLWRWDSLEDIS